MKPVVAVCRRPGPRRRPGRRVSRGLGVWLLDGLLLIAVLNLPADFAARPLGRVDVRVGVPGADCLNELLECPGFDSPIRDGGEYISGGDFAGDGARSPDKAVCLLRRRGTHGSPR